MIIKYYVIARSRIDVLQRIVVKTPSAIGDFSDGKVQIYVDYWELHVVVRRWSLVQTFLDYSTCPF